MRMRNLVFLVIIIGAILSLFLLMGGYNWIESVSLNYTMETDERLERLKVDRVIEILDLKPGRKIADIGAGTGLFTWPMARKTSPGGIVYAVDINPYILKDLDKKAGELGMANVRTVKAAENDPLIPERVDLIFSCGTFHYIDRQTEYFQGLHKYLKPGGRIAVIDLEKSHPVGGRIKYTPKEQEKWMLSAGFRRAGTYDFLKDFYFVVYEVLK